MRRTTSFCRICPAFCGIVVESEGDRIVRVTGDPEHPLSRGYTCSKGRAAPEQHHHPARLDVPMMRGPNGELEPASWDDVLDDIAGRVRTLVDEHGAEVVAQYNGSSGYDTANAVAAGFMAGLGSRQVFNPMTIDATTTWWVPQLMFGGRVPLPTCPDYKHAELLLLLGHNPLVSHGHTFRIDDPVVSLRDVRARGGTLVVVDPRRTETAHLADLHVSLRPGTDVAFLAFLVRGALAERPDQEFLAAVDGDSLSRLEHAVAPYTRDRVAATCDIDTDVLDRVWAAVRDTPRVALGTGTGLSMDAAGNAAQWLCMALLVVTGSLDRRGGTIFGPGVVARREEIRLRPRVPYDDRFETLTGGQRAPRILGSLPCAVLPGQIDAGAVRALFVLGGNPAVVFPESARTRQVLRSLDLLVAIDIRHTDTTALATHVLPTVFQFERADINLSLLHVEPFAQYTPAVLAPGADRRPTWWIYTELARRLGIPVGEVVDDDGVVERATSRSRIPLEVIRAAEHGVLDDTAPAPGWLIPHLLVEPIDLAPEPVLEQFADWEQALPGEGELALVCRRLPRQVNSMLREVEPHARRGPHPTLLVHPDDAARRGIDDGATVAVTSAHGTVSAVAEVTPAIRRGTVSLPHGWDAPNVNALTSYDDVDAVHLMPRFTGLPVSVAPEPG